MKTTSNTTQKPRPQDLMFTAAELKKAFAPKGKYSILAAFDAAEKADKEAD